MATRSQPRITYNGQLMAEDAASKGFDAKKLAKLSDGRLSLRTIYRFLSNEVQTVTTANELARIIGRPVSRYVVRSEERVPA